MKHIGRGVVALIKIARNIVSIICIPMTFLIAFVSRFVKRKYDIGIGAVP